MIVTLLNVFIILMLTLLPIFSESIPKESQSDIKPFSFVAFDVDESIPELEEKKELSQAIVYYNDPIALSKMVKEVFPNLMISVDQHSQTLVISGSQDDLQSAKNVIHLLDKSPEYVLLEMQIIEVNYEKFKEYKPFFSSLIDTFQFDYNSEKKIENFPTIKLILDQLIEQGFAKVVAKPVITTLNKQKATFSIGEKIPYITTVISQNHVNHQLKHLETGLNLSITPKKTRDYKLLIDVNLSMSSVKLWKTLESNKYPVLSERQVNTKVEIKSGKTLVIAGLFQEYEKKNIQGPTLLSQLPILGEFFKHKTTTLSYSDLLVLITPKLLDNNHKSQFIKP